MPDPVLESLLVADIGSVNTKVGLIDVVNGTPRFISVGNAATTAYTPEADVLVGVRDAIRQIQARTERQLLTNDQQLIMPERSCAQGVDAFVAITSAPPPLRLALVGLSRELSITSAMRAVNGAHASVVATLALDETGGRWVPVTVPPTPDAEDQTPTTVLQDPIVLAAETLARADVDAIVLVGGVERGATTALYDLANMLAVIIAARDESARPVVIFAGNSAARAEIAQRLGQIALVRSVDNVRPTMEQEHLAPLQRELESLYDEKKVKWLPGLTGLMDWTTAPILPSTQAFQNVVRYLARRYNMSVLGVDLGGGATTLVSARGDAAQSILRADIGLGHHLTNLVTHTAPERWWSWLPLELSVEQAHAHWLTQAAHPRALPLTRVETFLMHAAARGALATAAQDLVSDEFDLIVLSGGAFTANSNLGALALLALDALQPSGVFSIAVDPFGLVPALGGLATVHPEAAASVLERDGLVTLGTVIAPLSKNREGQLDARVQIKPAESGAINLEVQHGSLELIPLLLGQKALLEVRPANGVTLPRTKRGVFKAHIEGGALGLIIDARGRPIVLPSEADKRRTKIQQWYWDVGGEVTYG